MTKLVINPSKKQSKINKEIYGHFSEHLGRCIYEGIYVGEDSQIPNKNGMRTDVVEALKHIRIPVLRWPGGCFADEYHWKDGIGPKETRKKMINTHWGGVVEDNSFGTHEFFELCEQLGCEAYVNGNLGSGTVQEIQIFHTILRMVDNRIIYVPNGSLSSNAITNYNKQETRRAEWVFGVEYGEDYEKVKSVLERLIEADPRILKDPAPFIGLSSLSASSVDIKVRAWAKTSDYWDVVFDFNKTVYATFNKEGIGFPFPQLTVHQAQN